MTTFVHREHSNQPSDAIRVQPANSAAQPTQQNFCASRTLATLLLSAMAAAAMVVAYELSDTLAEGHLLALWIGLWVVAFATLAALAGTVSQAVASVQAKLNAWSRNIAAKRSDERLWAAAKTDPRVMADLQCAITRHQAGSDPRDDGLRFVAPKLVASDWLLTTAGRFAKSARQV